MSNIRNMNQVNPFWDFIASLQDPSNQAMFGQQRGGPPHHEESERADAFDGHWAGAFGPFGEFQRGGRHGPPGHGHGPRGGRRGPPPPPEHEGPEHGHEHRGPSHEGGPHHESHDRRSRHGHPHGPPPPHHEGGPRGPPPPHGPPPHHEARGPSPPPPFAEDPPSRAPTPPTPEAAEPHRHGHHGGPPPHHRRGGPFGGRGGHGHGHRGAHGHEHGHGPHGHGHGGRHGGPRGPFGGPRHGGPGFMGGAPFDLSALADAFVPGLFGGMNNSTNNTAARNGPAEDGTFTPEIDVFDTPSAYIIHASLPGAKKSELSITYSAQRSSVCISGVVTRPGVDEEMMAALALDERKIGSFEREVKLERGVQIEEDNIGAKLEDGVLRVTVPKVQLLEDSEEEYIDVKKVELE